MRNFDVDAAQVVLPGAANDDRGSGGEGGHSGGNLEPHPALAKHGVADTLLAMATEPRPTSRQMKVLREECLAHLDALYGTALRMTHNREEAEDLVQETYLKAVKNLHRYRDEGTCKAWLFRILTNTYIDHYREAQRRPVAVDFDDGAAGQYPGLLEKASSRIGAGLAPDRLEESASLASGELNELLGRILPDEVKAALDRLSDVFREMVVLRDIQGFSYREIADLLEIPIGTVMSRLYRARHLLQEDLWRYGAAHGYVRERAASARKDS
ncbi:RNA polymerase sigma factor SigR [soil metagenome]